MNNIIIRSLFGKTKRQSLHSKTRALRINGLKLTRIENKISKQKKQQAQLADEIFDLSEQIDGLDYNNYTKPEIESLKKEIIKKQQQYASLDANKIKLTDKMFNLSKKHNLKSTAYSTPIPLEAYAKKKEKETATITEDTIEEVAEKYGRGVQATGQDSSLAETNDQGSPVLSTENPIDQKAAFDHFFQEVSEEPPVIEPSQAEDQATFNSSMNSIGNSSYIPVELSRSDMFVPPIQQEPPVMSGFDSSSIFTNLNNFFEEAKQENNSIQENNTANNPGQLTGVDDKEPSSLENTGFVPITKVKPKQVTIRGKQESLEPAQITQEPNISSNTDTIEALKQQKMAALRRAQELNEELEKKNQLLELRTQAMNAQAEIYRSKEAALKEALEQLTKQNAEKESQLANLDSKIENVNAQKESIDKDSRALDEMLQELSPQDETSNKKHI